MIFLRQFSSWKLQGKDLFFWIEKEWCKLFSENHLLTISIKFEQCLSLFLGLLIEEKRRPFYHHGKNGAFHKSC